MEQATCFRCKRAPEEIGEYVDGAADYNSGGGLQLTPSEFMRSEEGTYNPRSNHFCCTSCYIMIGMPVGENGTRWVAP